MTTPDPLAAVRSPRLHRRLARSVTALALAVGLTAMPAASALAQSGGDEIFTTTATGLIVVRSDDLSWFAADGGRRTLVDIGDALFAAADDQLALQGVGDDATV